MATPLDPGMTLVLRENPSPDDTEWVFNVQRPTSAAQAPWNGHAYRVHGRGDQTGLDTLPL